MRRFILTIAVLTPFAAVAQTAAPATAPAATAPATAPATPPVSGWQQKFVARFEAANTTHDGHLTLAQAQAAGMHKIVKNFATIDTSHKGYVTLQDVQSWYLAHHHPATPPAPTSAN